MSISYPGRAIIDPNNPSALGICDRCGLQYNLRDLQYQWQWAGAQMVNTHLKVCSTCMDVPSEQLRTIILPPDPEPILDPRVEPFSLDEKNNYTLKPAGLGTKMFQATSSATVILTTDFVMVPTMTGISMMQAGFQQTFIFTALMSCTSSMTVSLDGFIILIGNLVGISAMEADLAAGYSIEPDFSVTSAMTSTVTKGLTLTVPPLLLGTEDGDVLATEDDDEITNEFGIISCASVMTAVLEHTTP